MAWPLLFQKALIYLLTIILFIVGPPTAERKEITKIVRMGDTLKLQCPMNGSPPMQFDWTKDNEQIKPYAWPR